MRIVAANHADRLRRFPSDGTDTVCLVDTVTDELRVHYSADVDEVPAEILALALRLDGLEAEWVFVA